MNFLLPVLPALLVSFAPPPPEQDYQEVADRLGAAIDNFAAEDRRASIIELQSALDSIARYPDEAPDDHTVSPAVLRAWVVLAGLHLAEGDEQASRDAMDEAIRTARDQPLEARAFGPTINNLYEARKAALEDAGQATIEVDCAVACEIVINERRLSERAEALLLGRYRVWIKASEGDAEWEFHEVELASAGEVQTLTYADPTPAATLTPVEPPPPASKPKKRMLPRAAEISGAVAGIGFVVAGAVLLSLHGKCDKTNTAPTADTTADQCGDIYNTNVAGYSLLGVGGGLFMVSGVLLSIDEVRVGREKGRQVMLGTTIRF